MEKASDFGPGPVGCLRPDATVKFVEQLGQRGMLAKEPTGEHPIIHPLGVLGPEVVVVVPHWVAIDQPAPEEVPAGVARKRLREVVGHATEHRLEPPQRNEVLRGNGRWWGRQPQRPAQKVGYEALAFARVRGGAVGPM